MNSRTATKHEAAQRIAWRTEYEKALLAAGPLGAQQISATREKGQRP